MTPQEPSLCVVLHDVAPATWAGCQRVLEAVHAVSPLPLTMLVVPRYHRTFFHPAFERQMDKYLIQGSELALHGYTHMDEMPVRNPAAWLQRRFYTAGEGEFAALSTEEAYWRLAAGRGWFNKHGWPLHGFVAPAWLLSAGSWRALRENGFRYTSTLRHLYMLPDHAHAEQRLTAQSLVYSTRSAWRRAMSIRWNQLLDATQEDAPLLRLELHPQDADFPEVRRSWQRLLAKALVTRTPVTTTDFVEGWRAQQNSGCDEGQAEHCAAGK